MANPAIILVSEPHADTLLEVFYRRYGHDYSLRSARSCSEAEKIAQEIKDAGESVALFVSDSRLPDVQQMFEAVHRFRIVVHTARRVIAAHWDYFLVDAEEATRLARPELGVDAASRQELAMAPLLDNAPHVHNHEAIHRGEARQRALDRRPVAGRARACPGPRRPPDEPDGRHRLGDHFLIRRSLRTGFHADPDRPARTSVDARGRAVALLDRPTLLATLRAASARRTGPP